MKFPSKAEVERVRETYSPGTRVELVSMDDPYTKLVTGDLGTVSFVDDIASVHISWDRGSSLAAVYEVDVIKIIADKAAGLKEINERENDLFRAYNCNIPEACDDLNNLQREKIEAIFKHHGTAFLGKVNFYGDERENLAPDRVFTKHDGGLVYNFAASFVIPCEDAELAEMVMKWNKNSASADIIDKITERVEVLGGANLTWS